jgi:hypothetical protein
MERDERAAKPEDEEKRDRVRGVVTGLPAGLEAPGRADELTSSEDAHPSGARVDHRHSVPGTGIPDGPEPAADDGESERIRDAVTERSEPRVPGPRAPRR